MSLSSRLDQSYTLDFNGIEAKCIVVDMFNRNPDIIRVRQLKTSELLIIKHILDTLA